MQITKDNKGVPWLSLGLIVLLVALAPFAMHFPPYRPYTQDALYDQRALMVSFGLLAAIASLVEFYIICLRHWKGSTPLSPAVAAFLACAMIGWRCYPYWVTGVYQVDLGAYSMMDQDPKGLIPMLWIGDVWRLGVLVLYLACIVATPGLLIAMRAGLRRHELAQSMLTASCIAVAAICMFGFSKHYLAWMMD